MGERFQSLLRGSERSLESNWGRWAREVSRALDGFLWVTMGQIREDPTTPPTKIAVGPTVGWVFDGAFNQYLYTELPIQTLVDHTKPLIVGVAWAPAASEAGRTVKWQLDIGLEREGADVAAIDLTKSQTASVPATAAVYERMAFTLSPAEWDGIGTDELHVRLSRAASGGTEPTLPGLHHIVLVQQLAL